MTDLQPERIPPNHAPGFLWRRITTGDSVLRAGPLSSTAGLSGIEDANDAKGWADEHGETVWVHIYDGDSGECVKTIIVQPGEY